MKDHGKNDFGPLSAAFQITAFIFSLLEARYFSLIIFLLIMLIISIELMSATMKI